ncbi:nickel pincer cofactor biosynthesis protein LarC [Furfurilactobacillus sp. WILCCON 0119]
MKTLYLDVMSGISGDMFLGALLDLGVDLSVVTAELNKLPLDHYSVTTERVAKSAIYGTSFKVTVANGTIDTGFTEEHEHHEGDHALTPEEPAHPYVKPEAGHHEHHHHHHDARHYEDIVHMITDADLSPFVKGHALAIFKEIALAEATVHQVALADVHFHEVGAIDSIIDIVGGCIALEQLHVDRVIASSLVDGTGFINVAHGRMPVPVPAVMQMRAGTAIPVRQNVDVHTELITPTGMGIVKTMVKSFGPLPGNMVVDKVGYGFGTREIGQLNALRALLCTSTSLSDRVVTDDADEIITLAANIDDQTAESLAPVIDQLLEAGAYDAYFEPIQMKKNRPAVKLTVIGAVADRMALTRVVLTQTSTAGVRYQTMTRCVMARTFTSLMTQFGPIRIKHLTYQDITKIKPEFVDCQAAAIAHEVPLRDVYQAVYQQFGTQTEN